MLENIRIVLVNTSHPGNIGGTARAMKNMGLTDLALVNPNDPLGGKSVARATNAVDVLENASIHATLDEAIADCTLVIGTSARDRNAKWPFLEVNEAARKLMDESEDRKVAMLFGQERMGLTNDEMDRCHYLVSIPTSGEHSSLNLVCAVQVCAYELLLASNTWQKKTARRPADVAPAAEQRQFHEHLEQTMREIEFIKTVEADKLMRKLINLYQRARLSKDEINTLRGILSAAQRMANLRAEAEKCCKE